MSDHPVETTLYSLSPSAPRRPERRHDERYLSLLRVGALIIGTRRELCLIRNISAGGLMAHVYSPVRPDQRVTVELKSNQPIEGSVNWVEGANAGIAFDTPVDITELLSTPQVLENGWRPRAPRVEIDRMATLRVGARTFWVHTRDVSQGGVKIETDQTFEVDTAVVVTLEHFRPLSGTVRWQKDRACGIAFNALIPFDQLIDWLKHGG